MLRAIKEYRPRVVTVYGGVYPTYHAGRVLAGELAVDVIVRDEGETAVAELVRAMETGGPCAGPHLRRVAGLGFPGGGGGSPSGRPAADRRPRRLAGRDSSSGGTPTGASAWGGRRSP